MNDSVRDDEGQQTGKLTQTVQYRCVCGTMLSVESGAVACPTCRREYDSSVLRSATAETTEITTAVLVSESPRAAGVDNREDPLVGQRLGHFVILSRIGQGGMGTVYRALDESLQRYVALKVLRAAAVESHAVDVQRLFQEARAQARVNHPHIAHIYYVGTDEDTPYLAMELVGHETLADQLKAGPLPFGLIVRCALQTARALEAAARFDIVHGDVKPANVLLLDEQTVKLSDFGLAYRLSETAGADAPTAGTPDYMPPEASDGRGIDHRGDMYSLGVTLFELTFGRLPYAPSSGNVHERLRQHREAAVEFPDPWPPELPLAWRELLTRLLAKRPAGRYPDFSQLISDLKQLEPRKLLNARPLLRGLAWLCDGMLVSAPLVVIALLLSANPRAALAFLGTALTVYIAVGISLLQAWWGTTPGKRLFQIRIVDQHGLAPGRSVLGMRAGFQFSWVWSIFIADLLRFFRLPGMGQAVSGLVLLFVLIEMGFVVLGKGRSVHDRIFGTRVALEAARPEGE